MEKAISNLKMLLDQRVPNATVTVDPPDRAEGNWWIDVRAGKSRVTLEYRPERGFGLFHENAGYGEGPAELYRTADLVARRVAQVIHAGKSRRSRLTLKDLRELYDCSQINLAEKVGVKQSAISRLEGRSEVKLGTLAAAVQALGGELEVRAHFCDADVPISVKD